MIKTIVGLLNIYGKDTPFEGDDLVRKVRKIEK